MVPLRLGRFDVAWRRKDSLRSLSRYAALNLRQRPVTSAASVLSLLSTDGSSLSLSTIDARILCSSAWSIRRRTSEVFSATNEVPDPGRFCEYERTSRWRRRGSIRRASTAVDPTLSYSPLDVAVGVPLALLAMCDRPFQLLRLELMGGAVLSGALSISLMASCRSSIRLGSVRSEAGREEELPMSCCCGMSRVRVGCCVVPNAWRSVEP